MSSKKILSVFSTPISEDAKNELIDNSIGISRQAADVMRDANGKVIAVSVNLPDTVSDKAIEAIRRNPGLASVHVNDITPGTTGFDGSQASLDAFIQAGGVKYIEGVTELDNEDGTFSLIMPDDSNWNSWILSKFGDTLPYPNEVTMELKFKFSKVADELYSPDLVVQMTMEDTHQLTHFNIANDGRILCHQPAGCWIQLSVTPDTNLHTLKMVSNNNTYSFYYDNELKGSAVVVNAGLASQNAILNVSGSAFSSGVSTGVTVDFWRYTQNV